MFVVMIVYIHSVMIEHIITVAAEQYHIRTSVDYGIIARAAVDCRLTGVFNRVITRAAVDAHIRALVFD